MFCPAQVNLTIQMGCFKFPLYLQICTNFVYGIWLVVRGRWDYEAVGAVNCVENGREEKEY